MLRLRGVHLAGSGRYVIFIAAGQALEFRGFGVLGGFWGLEFRGFGFWSLGGLGVLGLEFRV